MDLMQLAQASNPGAALPGMEWDQIRRYQNLNTINQGALQQAMPVAQSNAQRELQTNEEWNLAAPGRRDNITLGNMNAAAGVKDFDQNQASKKLEMALKDQKTRAEIQDFTKPLASYGDAFINAKPEEQEAMLDELARSGMTLPDGSRFGVDRKKDRFMLDMTGKARAGNPTVQVKRDVQESKNIGAKELADVKGQWAQKTGAERNAVMLEIAQMKQAADAARASNKPLSPDQQLYESVKRLANGDDAAMYAMWSQYKAAAVQAKLENEAEFLAKYKIKGPTQAPTHAPIIPGVVSGASSSAAKAPEKPKFEVGKVYTDKNGVKAKFTEKGWEIVKEGT